MVFFQNFIQFRPSSESSDKFIVNTAVMITLVSFLFMNTGCSYYKSATMENYGTENLLTALINNLYPKAQYPRDVYPEYNIRKMFFIQYEVFAVDSKGTWKLDTAELRNDTIFATTKLSPIPSASLVKIPDKREKVRYYPEQDKDFIKKVFLYTDNLVIDTTGKVCIPTKEISKIVRLKNDPSSKVGTVLLVCGGIAVLSLFIAMLVAIGNALEDLP
jgi:hypothetical protein